MLSKLSAEAEKEISQYSCGALWIAIVEVWDYDKYSRYVEQAVRPVKSYGGALLVRSNKAHSLEGSIHEARRIVMIGFPTEDAAKKCFYSTAYQAAREHRVGAAQTQLYILALETGKKIILES